MVKGLPLSFAGGKLLLGLVLKLCVPPTCCKSYPWAGIPVSSGFATPCLHSGASEFLGMPRRNLNGTSEWKETLQFLVQSLFVNPAPLSYFPGAV